jgi:hypothetical protein
MDLKHRRMLPQCAAARGKDSQLEAQSGPTQMLRPTKHLSQGWQSFRQGFLEKYRKPSADELARAGAWGAVAAFVAAFVLWIAA